MISLLVMASIPTITSAALTQQAPQAQQQATQQAKNREFIMKNYPPGARQRGEQGRVAFRVTIEPDGTLGQCEVTESSGFAGLDNETCEIMVRYGQLKPIMGADGRAIRATQNGFIVWRLPDDKQVAAAAPGSVPKTMEKPDEIICKKSVTTGSLIGSTRQCLSRADWALQERMWRDELERIQGRGAGEEGN
jgi:protein TonB